MKRGILLFVLNSGLLYGQTIKVDYFQDGGKKITEVTNENETKIYEFNSDKLLSLYTIQYDKRMLKDAYEYDENNRVKTKISMSFLNIDKNIVSDGSKEVFEYDKWNRVSKKQWFTYHKNKWKLYHQDLTRRDNQGRVTLTDRKTGSGPHMLGMSFFHRVSNIQYFDSYQFVKTEHKNEFGRTVSRSQSKGYRSNNDIEKGKTTLNDSQVKIREETSNGYKIISAMNLYKNVEVYDYEGKMIRDEFYEDTLRRSSVENSGFGRFYTVLYNYNTDNLLTEQIIKADGELNTKRKFIYKDKKLSQIKTFKMSKSGSWKFDFEEKNIGSKQNFFPAMNEKNRQNIVQVDNDVDGGLANALNYEKTSSTDKSTVIKINDKDYKKMKHLLNIYAYKYKRSISEKEFINLVLSSFIKENEKEISELSQDYLTN